MYESFAHPEPVDNQNIRRTAHKEMLDIIYHQLPKVHVMYRSTFGIEFPEIKQVLACVTARHDLLHRNGRTKSGDFIYLNTAEVAGVLSIIDDFVEDLAIKLGMKKKPPENSWGIPGAEDMQTACHFDLINLRKQPGFASWGRAPCTNIFLGL